MKRFIVIISLLPALMIQSCSIFKGMSAEELEARQNAVMTAIANMDMTIEVGTIHPMSGSPIHSNGEYSLTIRDGKVSSYLPFFGVSRNFTYGSTDSGIKFKDAPIRPNVYASPKKKDLTIIEFQAKSFDDVWDVTVELWNNGKATIMCVTREKTPMHYDGELSFYDEKK